MLSHFSMAIFQFMLYHVVGWAAWYCLLDRPMSFLITLSTIIGSINYLSTTRFFFVVRQKIEIGFFIIDSGSNHIFFFPETQLQINMVSLFDGHPGTPDYGISSSGSTLHPFFTGFELCFWYVFIFFIQWIFFSLSLSSLRLLHNGVGYHHWLVVESCTRRTLFIIKHHHMSIVYCCLFREVY